MNKRLTKDDWLNLGLQALGESGPEGLTIESICHRAQKTRGSYYHHFNSATDFEKQLLAWWQENFTDAIIEKVERLGHAGDKLDHLNLLAAHLDPHVEQGFRRLAARSKEAAIICKIVDGKRIEYLAKLYEKSPRFDRQEAKMLARIEYAAWVGFQLIEPDAKPQDMLKMYDTFLQLTGRG